MKFGPQRGHITCIFDNFFKDFGLVLVAIVVSLVSGDMDLLLENAGILVIVLLGPVMRILGYLTTTYAIDEEKLMRTVGFRHIAHSDQSADADAPLCFVHET